MRTKPGSCKNLKYFMPREKLASIYGDESHVCTEGYVPYGWQFFGEDVYVPSERAKRLNIFGMTGRDNHFEGFCTNESVNAEKKLSTFSTGTLLESVKRRLSCLIMPAYTGMQRFDGCTLYGKRENFTFSTSLLILLTRTLPRRFGE
jgi:hypothetical protein